jgi:hypothetical protein
MTDRERAMLEKLKAKEQAEKKEQAKLQRQFKDLCKKNFGKTPTEIADILQAENGAETHDNKLASLGESVATYYGLQSDVDIQKWCEVMLNDTSKNFWMRQNTN